MNRKIVPPDDWSEPNINIDPSKMRLPPGFIPNNGDPQPSYVPNSPAGAYTPPNLNMQGVVAPNSPMDIQTPEEAMAYMQKNLGTPQGKPQPAPVQKSNDNPLAKYFRIPGIHVTLPSRGFFNKNEIEFEMNGEIAVFPMTASDELRLKNPDSLMSGNSIETVIKSCVPAIKNPKYLPIQDGDVLMLAIRAATFGNNMAFEVECPKCKAKNEYQLNIRELIETITFLEEEYPIQLDNGLIVYLKPYTLELQSKLNIATFQEAKKMQYAESSDLPEEAKLAKFSESFKVLNDLNLELITSSILGIVTPEGTVTDKKFIYDFLKNCSRQYTKVIDETFKEMGNKGLNKKKEIICCNEECKHEWESDLVFDPTSFFD